MGSAKVTHVEQLNTFDIVDVLQFDFHVEGISNK